jgi:hypothetical protein
MYCFSGCTQSISFVCLRGQDIIGACTILTSYAEGHTQRVGFSMTRASSLDHEASCLCLFLFDSRGVPVDSDQDSRLRIGHAA